MFKKAIETTAIANVIQIVSLIGLVIIVFLYLHYMR